MTGSVRTPWRKSRRAGVLHGGRTRLKLTDGLLRRTHSLKPPRPEDARPVFRVDNPSRDFFFPVTPEEVREALSRLPPAHVEALTHVWFRRVARRDFEEGHVPFAEFVRGSGVAAIILYPWRKEREVFYGPRAVPASVLRFYAPCVPQVVSTPEGHVLRFTEEGLRRFYLENLLLHEVGHLVDASRPGRRASRGRGVEGFADDYAIRWSVLGRTEENE